MRCDAVRCDPAPLRVSIPQDLTSGYYTIIIPRQMQTTTRAAKYLEMASSLEPLVNAGKYFFYRIGDFSYSRIGASSQFFLEELLFAALTFLVAILLLLLVLLDDPHDLWGATWRLDHLEGPSLLASDLL